MSKIQEIDRSLIAIFDIEGFSKANPLIQAELVKLFVESLDQRLKNTGILKPDAFSTGDGAIVSIGRKNKIEKTTAKLFIDFVVDFVLTMVKKGVILRTTVNYSERDKILIIDKSLNIQGKYIQIGDTINTAARIIMFCEPREIMISKSVHELLRKVSLENTYHFFENDPFFTKHNEVLNTFTYVPYEDEQEYLYTPHSVSHQYKKFRYFPPIESSVLKYFADNGLDFDLKKIISGAFESIKELNYTKRFISWNTVINVLIQLHYDPEDTVYVLSRDDRPSRFWTQHRKSKYIRHLKNNTKQSNGYINQIRVRVYDDSQDKLMPADDIFHDLKKLHNTNTLFSFPSSYLFKYEKLNDLIFGFTLSKKHKYAIISIPAPEAIGIYETKLDDIGKILRLYEEYNVTDGPLKAIIVADWTYIETLIEEMERLLRDPQINEIK